MGKAMYYIDITIATYNVVIIRATSPEVYLNGMRKDAVRRWED